MVHAVTTTLALAAMASSAMGAAHVAKRAGGIDFDWTSGFASAENRAETIKVGDTIKFSWTGTHNVFKFEDQPAAKTAKQQFDDCDFTNAVLVDGCATVAGGSCTTGANDFGTSGTSYYACQVGSGGHCKGGQKLAVTAEEVPVAQSAMEFCADYDTKCAAQPNNFVDTDTCKVWYEAADDGVLAGADTVYSNTKACYQQHLSVSNDETTQAAHCPHARGTAKCVAPPAGPDCTLAMHATEADAITCSDDGEAHKMGDKWGSGATHTDPTKEPDAATPVAQTATQFCADYERKCSAEDNNFADTATCEAWYGAAADGVLAGTATVSSNTKACYQEYLSYCYDADSQALFCSHARGTEQCVAPPAETDSALGVGSFAAVVIAGVAAALC